jgi:hypothetical protein
VPEQDIGLQEGIVKGKELPAGKSRSRQPQAAPPTKMTSA